MSPSFIYVRQKDLADYGIPISKSAVHARASAGTFPRPVKLGARASAWRSDELDRWKADPTGYRAAA